MGNNNTTKPILLSDTLFFARPSTFPLGPFYSEEKLDCLFGITCTVETKTDDDAEKRRLEALVLSLEMESLNCLFSRGFWA